MTVRELIEALDAFDDQAEVEVSAGQFHYKPVSVRAGSDIDDNHTCVIYTD
jgi:hypothetical protein